MCFKFRMVSILIYSVFYWFFIHENLWEKLVKHFVTVFVFKILFIILYSTKEKVTKRLELYIFIIICCEMHDISIHIFQLVIMYISRVSFKIRYYVHLHVLICFRYELPYILPPVASVVKSSLNFFADSLIARFSLRIFN